MFWIIDFVLLPDTKPSSATENTNTRWQIWYSRSISRQ